MVFAFSMARHYMFYAEILEDKKNPIEVTEKSDFESLSNMEMNTLEQLGFSEKQINAVKEIDSEHLTLRDFINIFEAYDKSVNPYDLVSSEINLQQESNEGDFVEINVVPVETVYVDGKNKTFYTRLHYTVDFKKPMLFQSQDQFRLDFNEWYPWFGYAKLHYVSKKGDEYEEYVTREETGSYKGVPFNFEVRKQVDGKTFYLSGISGIYILSSQNFLSLYAEYDHKQLIRNKVLGKHRSDWDWIFEK